MRFFVTPTFVVCFFCFVLFSQEPLEQSNSLLAIDDSNQQEVQHQNYVRSLINWKQHKKGKIRLIYPKESTQEAKQVHRYLHSSLPFSALSLSLSSDDLPVLPVVLNNTISVSNGFFTVIPTYTEFFTYPQSLGTSEGWLKLLSVHEGHHFVQFEALKSTIGKQIWFFLGGGFAIGTMAGLYVPTWFFEGNATAQETLQSYSGRGQHPIFTLALRAKEFAYQRSSYEETYLQHPLLPLIQDEYDIGYTMTTYAQYHYGPLIWGKVLNRLNRYFIFPNFNYAIKKHTNLSIESLYHNSLDFYRQQWQEQNKYLVEDVDSEIVYYAEISSVWNGLLSPVVLSDGRLLAVAVGNKTATELVEVDNFYRPTRIISLVELPNSVGIKAIRTGKKVISVGGDKVVWIDRKPHLFEQNQSYADIWIYDVGNNYARAFTQNQRFVTASINHDGTKIAAFQKKYNGFGELQIYDVETGQLQKKQKLPLGMDVFEITWVKETNTIATSSVYLEQGVFVQEYDFVDQSFVEVLPPLKGVAIRNLSYWDRYIVFQADISGVDQIYAMDTTSQEWYQLTQRSLGAYYPYIDKQKERLFFSDYSVNGFSLLEKKLNKRRWKSYKPPLGLYRIKDAVLTKILKELKQIEEQESQINLGLNKNSLEVVDENQESEPSFQEKEFYSGLNLFKLHSWNYLPFGVDNTAVQFSLFFTNYLSTFQAEVSYFALFGKVFGQFTYSNFFPNITLSTLVGLEGLDFLDVQADFPLNFSQNSIVRHLLAPSVGLRIPLENEGPAQLKYQFSWSLLQRPKTFLSIFPLYGGEVFFLGFNDLDRFASPSKYDLNVSAFFPGLSKIQGLKVSVCVGDSDVESRCNNRLSQFFGRERFVWTTTYVADLGYPSFSLGKFFSLENSLGSLFYLKKISLALFAEYWQILDGQNERKEYIVGTEYQLLTSLLSNRNVDFRFDILVGLDLLRDNEFQLQMEINGVF